MPVTDKERMYSALINHSSSLKPYLEHYYTRNNVLLMESCYLGGILFQTQQDGGRGAGVLGVACSLLLRLPIAAHCTRWRSSILALGTSERSQWIHVSTWYVARSTNMASTWQFWGRQRIRKVAINCFSRLAKTDIESSIQVHLKVWEIITGSSWLSGRIAGMSGKVSGSW